LNTRDPDFQMPAPRTLEGVEVVVGLVGSFDPNQTKFDLASKAWRQSLGFEIRYVGHPTQ
jgi:hypothetical protein